MYVLIRSLTCYRVPPSSEAEEKEDSAEEDEPSNKKLRLSVDDSDTRISISSSMSYASINSGDMSEIEEIVEIDSTEDTDVIMMQSIIETAEAELSSNTYKTNTDNPAQAVPGTSKMHETAPSSTPKLADIPLPSTSKAGEKDTPGAPETDEEASIGTPTLDEKASPGSPKPAKKDSPGKRKRARTPSPTKSNPVEVTPDEMPSTTTSKPMDIHEANTQVVLNTSTDPTYGEKSPVQSTKVALPQTPKKVTFLEKAADDSLPSTSESDDVQITCGQQVNSSPETKKMTPDPRIKSPSKVVKDKENASVATNGTKQVNGKVDKDKPDIEVKITSTEVSVDAMLADFVDEVNDEPHLVT